MSTSVESKRRQWNRGTQGDTTEKSWCYAWLCRYAYWLTIRRNHGVEAKKKWRKRANAWQREDLMGLDGTWWDMIRGCTGEQLVLRAAWGLTKSIRERRAALEHTELPQLTVYLERDSSALWVPEIMTLWAWNCHRIIDLCWLGLATLRPQSFW